MFFLLHRVWKPQCSAFPDACLCLPFDPGRRHIVCELRFRIADLSIGQRGIFHDPAPAFKSEHGNFYRFLIQRKKPELFLAVGTQHLLQCGGRPERVTDPLLIERGIIVPGEATRTVFGKLRKGVLSPERFLVTVCVLPYFLQLFLREHVFVFKGALQAALGGE